MAKPPSNKEPKAKRQAGMAFILVTLFIDILGISLVIPVLPTLVQEFVGQDTSLAARYVGVIGGSYALMQFLCAPIMGALSDRFGRRPVLLAAMFGLGIDYIIQGFAPSIVWLFVGRILAGMMGASFSTANAYIADVSTPENRARNFGLVGVMFGLGFSIGPFIGGTLGAYYLRLPFFFSAGLALANWLYGYFILPESLPPKERSDVSLAKMNPFGTLERLRAYPIISGLAAAFVCISLAQRGLESVWVLFTEYRFHWSPLMVGASLGVVGVTAMIVQGGLVRPIIRLVGERRTVIIGLAISAITFLGYGLANQGWMVFCWIAFGALGGVAGPAIQSLVAGSVPPSEQGKIQGAITSLMSLTNIIAPLVFTTGLFSYFTSEKAPIKLPGIPFLIGSLLLVVALVIALRVFQRIPESDTEGKAE